MADESRVKKSLLNARVNLVFYFLSLALSFFSRKIFLDCLGADFVGLTGTLLNLLGFLNLAELGIGTAIGYVLYKPIFEHDTVKINEIISVFGYLYRWIGRVILVIGCIVALFLPAIFPDTPFDLRLIIFVYFSFLISSLIGYFINYRQNLLGADQKNYVITVCYQSVSIIKTLVQMGIAYYTHNYYLWIIIELGFGIIYSFILNWQIDRVYPWLKNNIREGRRLFKKYPEVMRYTKQLFVHKLGAFTQFQTTPFLIYSFVSLETVAFYGNYTIITQKANSLINNLLDSTGAGIGNLIAENNPVKIQRVFWELMAMRFWIAGIFIFAVYNLLPSFIQLWIGKEYLLSETVLILLLINSFIGITRGSTEQFLYGYGLFYDTWAPLTEAILFIVMALVGGYYWGLSGILLGGVVSLTVIICIWKPYFLFTKGLKRSVWEYWRNWLLHLVITFISFKLSNMTCKLLIDYDTMRQSWWSWIAAACILCLTITIIEYIFLYVFTPGMRDLTKRFKEKLSKCC